MASRKAAVLPLVALAIAIALAGCGLQTDEANQALEKANKHQEEAEVILGRLRAFPGEWEANFSTLNSQQVIAAQQLVKAREQDVDALSATLKEWKADMRAINKLNVDEKIKEYVRLKINSINCWSDYTESFLLPIVKGYGGLVQTMVYGRPQSEQTEAAMDITTLVSESLAKLEECRIAEEHAADYFKNNRLGK